MLSSGQPRDTDFLTWFILKHWYWFFVESGRGANEKFWKTWRRAAPRPRPSRTARQPMEKVGKATSSAEAELALRSHSHLNFSFEKFFIWICCGRASDYTSALNGIATRLWVSGTFCKAFMDLWNVSNKNSLVLNEIFTNVYSVFKRILTTSNVSVL